MTLNQIKQIIETNVSQSTVYVLDPMNDGQHLEAIVISPIFKSMMLIKQHQMVMKPLKEAMRNEVHALGLKTFTPEKWELVKGEFDGRINS